MAMARLAIKNPSFWLGIFLLAFLITGLYVFQDFGISHDEPGIFRFTPIALKMYTTAFDSPNFPVYQNEPFLVHNRVDPILFNYGPFYFMSAELFTRSMHSLGVNLPAWDLWHLAYLLTFEICILTFFLLCRRWLSGWASLGATLLFATQPLIVGHAFMNPKDPPFMFFFMAAIYSGLYMADKLVLQLQGRTFHVTGGVLNFVIAEWKTLSAAAGIKAKRNLLWGSGGIFFVLLTHPVWSSILRKVMGNLYEAPETSSLGRILRIFSSHPEKIPVENFIIKSQIWLTRLEFLVILLIIGVTLWAYYFLMPKSGMLLAQVAFTPFHLFFLSLVNPTVMMAGILLGLTFSIRLFAPLAGGLVVLYLLWKLHWRGIPALLAYGSIVLVVTYLTWPYLWKTPIRHIIKSWQVMSAFPISGSWKTLPTLLAIQYTEPVIFLALTGIIIALLELIRNKKGGMFFLFLGWSILPLGMLVWKKTFLYDNFRQILFLIPPLFIMAGLTIEKIIKFARQPLIAGLLVFAAVVPGIWAGMGLHPYEYVYYNQFVGGVEGAFRAFDTDYWGISLKETAEYLNESAPSNSIILVCAPIDSFTPYLRTDLAVFGCEETPDIGAADYAVIYSRYNYDTIYYPQANVIYSVVRDNATFAVIKSLKDNPNK